MRHFVLAAALLAALSTPAPAFSAAEVKAGDIAIDRAWARASAGPAANGAAYLTLRSQGAGDRLVSAAAEAAEKTELHTHVKEGTVMRMRPVDAIEVPAGASVELKPGGLHVMLLGLRAPLKEGDILPITLQFEKAGKVVVEAQVMGPGAMAPGGHDGGGHGPMSGHK